MWVARIERPGALYDASFPSQTSETAGETIINPIDFEEVADVDVSKLIGADSYAHMPGFGGINRKPPKGLESCKFTEENIKIDKSKTHFKANNLSGGNRNRLAKLR